MMKKLCILLLLTAFFVLCTPCALAATLPDFTAERTGYGMELSFDGNAITIDGKVICAAYDEEGRMLAADLLTPEEAVELTLYCDVNEVRRMAVFAVNEALKPIAEISDTQLAAPETPIHLHTWNKTPDETIPATCTDTGLQRFKCTGCKDGDLEKVLPALEHSWGDWTYTNASVHTATCIRDAAHTNTAAHNWDNGVVTVEPTETETGVKTYTCKNCNGTKTEELPLVTANNIWFRANGSSYYLCWTPVEVPAGQHYYVNGTSTNSTSSEKYMNIELQNLTASKDITIGVGNRSVGVTTLYTLPNAIVLEELPAEAYTLTGQQNGTYLVQPSNSGDAFSYTFTDPSGLKIANGTATSPSLSLSPWDGCQVTLSRTVTTISADTFSMKVQKTPAYTVTSFTHYVPSAEVQEVTTAAQLKNALLSGGTVKLVSNISASGSISLNTGAAAVLDLNGYQIDGAYFSIQNGKELTIIGTTEGSAISYSSGHALTASAGSKLIIEGGTYGSINVSASGNSPCRQVAIRNAAIATDGNQRTAISISNASTVTLTNVTASAAYGVVSATGCGPFTISGGSYTCTFTSNTNSIDAISINSCEDISITNATVNSTFKGIRLYACDDILVDGCTLTSTGIRQSLTYCLEASDCGDITINDTEANAITRVMSLYKNGAVSINNCTLTADYMENLPGTALEASSNECLAMNNTAIYAVTNAADLSSMSDVSVKNCIFSSADPDGLTSSADTCVSISKVATAAVTDTSIAGEHVLNLAQCDTVTLTDSAFIGKPTAKIADPQSLTSTNTPDLSMTRVTISGNCNLSSLTALTDSTVENGTFAINSECAATVTNTDFTDSQVYVQYGATVTLVSGDHITSDYWLALVQGYQGTIIIQSGLFQNTNDPESVFGSGFDSSNLMITGGTFSQDPSDYVDSTVYEVQPDRDLYIVVPKGTAPKKYTAVPTLETTDFSTVTGPTLMLSQLSEEDLQYIEKITLTSQVNDGTIWSFDYPASAQNCCYLSGDQLKDLLQRDNTVHITLTTHPTEAAAEEGYGAGTAAFDLTFFVNEEYSPYSSDGITAQMSGSDDNYTMTLTNLGRPNYFLISGYQEDGFVQAHLVCSDNKGKATLSFTADPQYTHVTLMQISNIYADAAGVSLKRAFFENAISVTLAN